MQSSFDIGNIKVCTNYCPKDFDEKKNNITLDVEAISKNFNCF